MALKSPELESELLEAVLERVRERIPADQVDACLTFVRQYYQWVPPADLAGRNALDLYGTVISHWRLVQERQRQVTRVEVRNPTLEADGWESPHTVIQIVSDDMPFIVDSVTMELGRLGCGLDLVIHPVLRVRRDAQGSLLDVLEHGDEAAGAIAESVLHIEITRVPDAERQQRLHEGIERVLRDVRAVVEDWKPMEARAGALIAKLEKRAGEASPKERTGFRPGEPAEAAAFLSWLTHDNFTFLGYREYDLVADDGQRFLRAVPDSGLGIMRGDPQRTLTPLSTKALELAEGHLLMLTKANSRATVHRPAYMDYVGVKRLDDQGRTIGERRFLGLYTTRAYKATTLEIPLLSGKVQAVLERAGFPSDSHDHKALLEIIESYPRDSLFQMDVDELYDIATGILGLGERQRVRLFVRRDRLDRYVECHVCIPRDRFNTENRERVGRILVAAFGGSHLDWTLQLSESRLARVHYIIHTPDGAPTDYDAGQIEIRLAQAVRAWHDDLSDALLAEHGEEEGLRLLERYEQAFPPGFRSDWAPRAAVVDIAQLERLRHEHGPILILYRPVEGDDQTVRCKLYSSGRVSLSNVLPIFEHMGTRVIDERPYEVRPADGSEVWIYDFGLQVAAEEVEPARGRFEEAFLGVWHNEYEDDGFGALVLRGGLSGREVALVRAIAKYLRQGGIAFSDAYLERTLARHAEIAGLLVRLFGARLDPASRDPAAAERLTEQIGEAIDAVESLDEDRILRSFLTVTCAVLRTNYFRRDAMGVPRHHLSFKLDPSQIGFLPRPRPQFEIFVYSPRVEGVHLRGGHVARGGLRWSDRREDFRTEVLGLMKAQMVKNALIVPVGSKGGFVVKRPPAEGGREALGNEAIACYRVFLRGLLDVTDNIVDGKVVAPDDVVRYDGDDPYLVVAADKGTASFSDIANEISAEYDFWLGDAFASGGSRGYDHKQMGITARGAWESVKRHFRELGTDIQSSDFTVVGIGDMSGDVFGNGMLLSRHIRLVAAFNHMHVFIDPDPDPETSFAERERLFGLGRSGWSDYDTEKISKGGGVYLRSAKSITLSEQAQAALGVDAEELPPAELIQAILRAPVDLFWNGGIGTYVKASAETHAEAGDKSNDAVRVDADELRCRVVGEGGNLGFTQRGRVEYALGGGKINTDAIDNVAGVNCSDHEVNIKILLDAQIAARRLGVEERNALLVEMTNAVADQVLSGSYTQTQALSLSLAQAPSMVDVHARMIRWLEKVGGLDRELEFLPSDRTINQRKTDHQGLVAPELAVLMAYCKIHLYDDLLHSDLPEDPYLAHDLERYFPPPLPERYGEEMRAHRLRREIIATVVANQLVDRSGTTFAFRLAEETGASASLLARGYAVAREVFEMRAFWAAVQELDNQVDAQVQLEMLIEGRRLVERSTRWLVRDNPDGIDVEALIHHYEPGARALAEALPGVLDGGDREGFHARAERLREAGVPDELARRVACMFSLVPVFDIVSVADATGREQREVMETHLTLGAQLELNWLRDRVLELPRTNRWQGLARAALRDDLYALHRNLTREVLESAPAGASAGEALEAWSERQRVRVRRWERMLTDIKASRTYDMTTLPVAMREVRNLIRGIGARETPPPAA